ncbi:MAG: T9SS type A sorting domain-containing protein [Bacteroidales bacterium]
MKAFGVYLKNPAMAILFFLLAGRLVSFAQTTLPDSVIFQGTKMDIGEKFRISGFPSPASFGHYTINSYFKEPDGTEHLAYVDNYKLYYFKSTDDGAHWAKEQVMTSNEGDIRNCALTVDTNGKVFIGITVNNNLNYSNPPATAYGSEWYFDLYCVNNKTGSWVKELVSQHSGNSGALVEGLFVDAGNHVHMLANYYGWGSYGGTAWEWIRNANTNVWGAAITIAQFMDTPVDRFINDSYTVAHNRQGKVTLVMSRETTTTSSPKPRLFYVHYDGSKWLAPVTITDSIAIAWNRFDAVVDTAGHTYIYYLKNSKLGVPELKVIKDLMPAQPVSINLPAGDTLNYFRIHCNSKGLFTMYLYLNKVINTNTQVAFSYDPVHWTNTIPVPADLKKFIGGVIVKTDTRRGYFTDYCKQVLAIAGPRTTQPYGPDELYYGSLKLLETSVGLNADLISSKIILKQNYPNPFYKTSILTWQLPRDAHVVLKVYDHIGCEVRTLVNCDQQKGEHFIKFDAAGLPAGVYIYQLQANGKVITKKMIYLNK